MRTNRIALVAFWLLVAASVVCMGKGFLNAVGQGGIGTGALSNSKDFQWSPAWLFVRGIDPYLASLTHDPRLLAQAPNYLPSLYVLFAPFGVLPFDVAKIIWAVCNVALAVATPILIASRLGWSRTRIAFLVVAFLVATPTRTVVSNGQQALLITFCAILAYTASRPITTGAALAVAIVKHSFAPPLVIGLLYRLRYAAVAWAGAISLVLTAIFSAVVQETPWRLLTSLLKVNRTSVNTGIADVMSVSELVVGGRYGGLVSLWIALLTLVILVVMSRKMLRGDWLPSLAAAAAVSLLSFKHLIYDYVFLLPIIVYALTAMYGWRRIVVIAVIGYFWYLFQFVSALAISTIATGQLCVTVVTFILLAGALLAMVTDPSVQKPSRRAVIPARGVDPPFSARN
jgi:hypothetical protein